MAEKNIISVTEVGHSLIIIEIIQNHYIFCVLNRFIKNYKKCGKAG